MGQMLPLLALTEAKITSPAPVLSATPRLPLPALLYHSAGQAGEGRRSSALRACRWCAGRHASHRERQARLQS